VYLTVEPGTLGGGYPCRRRTEVVMVMVVTIPVSLDGWWGDNACKPHAGQKPSPQGSLHGQTLPTESRRDLDESEESRTRKVKTTRYYVTARPNHHQSLPARARRFTSRPFASGSEWSSTGAPKPEAFGSSRVVSRVLPRGARGLEPRIS
jgi:hypothetical protein